MQKPTLKHWLMLASLVVVWGGAFGLIAVALRAFHPVTVVWIRLLLGAMTMLIILRLMGKSLPREFVWWRRMLVLSFAGNILPFCLFAFLPYSLGGANGAKQSSGHFDGVDAGDRHGVGSLFSTR